MISSDSYVFWTTVASVGLGAVLSGAGALWVHTEHYRNTLKLARLAGGRFDSESTETPDMSDKPRTDTLFIVEYWHDHLSVEPLVNLLNSNGFTVTNVVLGKCKTASSYPIVVCYVTKDVLVSETDRMTELLKANDISCFRVEGFYAPATTGRAEITIAGSVLAFAKPEERAAAAADQEALRQSATIEG